MRGDEQHLAGRRKNVRDNRWNFCVAEVFNSAFPQRKSTEQGDPEIVLPRLCHNIREVICEGLQFGQPFVVDLFENYQVGSPGSRQIPDLSKLPVLCSDVNEQSGYRCGTGGIRGRGRPKLRGEADQIEQCDDHKHSTRHTLAKEGQRNSGNGQAHGTLDGEMRAEIEKPMESSGHAGSGRQTNHSTSRCDQSV